MLGQLSTFNWVSLILLHQLPSRGMLANLQAPVIWEQGIRKQKVVSKLHPGHLNHEANQS